VDFFKHGEREVVATLLISLMKDRMSSLNKKGVKAVVFRPEISDTETKDASSCLQVGALSSEF